MTVELTDGVNGDGLFDILGKYFFYLDTLNTARLTTVPDQALDAINQYKKKTDTTFDFDVAVDALPSADQAWRLAGDAASQAAFADCQALLIEFVRADTTKPIESVDDALEYLIDQMITNGDYLANSTNASVVSAEDGGNSTNDVYLTTYNVLPLARVENMELAIPETINLEVTSIDGNYRREAITLTMKGDDLVELFSEKYPLGAGIDTEIITFLPSDSLILNGDFEDEAVTDQPDSWIVQTGTIGTDVSLSNAEAQRLIIAGTPTAGTYVITWDNQASDKHSTANLAFDASGSAVELALRTIPGMDLVTVITTGTSPNFTHDITMTGVASDVNTIAAISHLDTGTITPSQVTAGEAAYQGKSLVISGAARLVQPIASLDTEQVYFIHYRLRKTGTVSSGNHIVALVTDIDGGTFVTIPSDLSPSNQIKKTVAFGDLTTSWVSHHIAFTLRNTQRYPIYIMIYQDALTGGGSVLVDDLVFVEGVELSPGGPAMAMFSGVDPPRVGDRWTITVTNDRDNDLQQWCDRTFDLKSLQRQFPVAGLGSLIPDSLIS